MKLMFVYWAFEDQGSGLLIQGYTRAARAMGHDVVVYGRPNPRIPLNYSMSAESADAIVCIFEWTTDLMHGDNLDWVRILNQVPRHRRVIVDGDGNYNDPVQVGGDQNHTDAASSRRWSEICDSVTDKICQPTFHPRRANVRPFLFYSYNPAWERPQEFSSKPYSMMYVGNSKFRWPPMKRVLQALQPIKDRVGRLAIVGHGWDRLPEWAVPMKMEQAYYTDPAYMAELGVELLPPVPFEQVVDWMSKATFNPVVSRPTFNHLRLVTPRYFETPAASTIPLFGLDAAYVQEIYGDEAMELVLPAEHAEEKILDLIERPDHYAGIVRGIRRHLVEKHSQADRLRELIAIIES